MMSIGAVPAWLPLLSKPYEEILGSRNSWDLALPDGSRVRVDRGSQGFNNALFRARYAGEEYACKLFVVDERRRAYREWVALLALQRAGHALAPEPIAQAPEDMLPQPAIVTRWVEGTALTSQELSAADLASVVSTMAQVHQTPPAPGNEFLPAWHQPDTYDHYLDEARGFLQQVEAWAAGAGPIDSFPGWVADLPSLVPLLRQALAMAEATATSAASNGCCPQPALIHVDGNLEHFLLRPDGRLAIIDWEYSGWGDPAFDLAGLRWHPRALSIGQKRWEAALADYPASAGDPTFQERLEVYSRLLPAWWLGRSALHLLEGIGHGQSSRRLVRIPERLFRAARRQLNNYLAALGLIELEAADGREND